MYIVCILCIVRVVKERVIAAVKSCTNNDEKGADKHVGDADTCR